MIDELRFSNTTKGIESLIERVRMYGEFEVVIEELSQPAGPASTTGLSPRVFR